MSEFKLVPVELTGEMRKAGIRWLTGFQHMRAGDKRNALNEAFKAMLAAAPQPPTLGGEVHRWQLKGFIPGIESVSKAVLKPWVVMADDFDTHVARLQAEVERLKQLACDRKDQQTEMCTQINDLEARNAELEGLLRRSAQEIRSLSDSLLNACEDFDESDEGYTSQDECEDAENLAQEIDAALAEGKEHE